MHVNIEAISGVCGSISIACWVVVFSPQIIENFRKGSAEALSILFLVIWLAGDIFNIIGAVAQGVLPTMIILALYYTLADIVLILQCFYYRGFTLKDKVNEDQTTQVRPNSEPSETSALLPNGEGASSSRNALNKIDTRHNAIDESHHLSPATPLHPKKRDIAAMAGQSPVQSRSSLIKTIAFNTAAVLVVCAAGGVGWWLSTKAPSHSHESPDKGKHKHEKGSSQRTDLEFSVIGQVFGYLCAVFYLGSRIPQLLLNYRRKSTDGISMLFFVFACLGNITYVLSILAYEPMCYHESRNGDTFGALKHHPDAGCKPGEAGQIYARNILVNFSWLLGSFGTLFLDAAVFIQWYIYRGNIPEATT